MHLLLAQKGTISDGNEAVDLGQTPGEIVFLSATDTELASIAQAHRLAPDMPSLRLANFSGPDASHVGGCLCGAHRAARKADRGADHRR